MDIKHEIDVELHFFKQCDTPYWNLLSPMQKKILNEDVEKLSRRIYEIFEKRNKK